MVGRLAEFGMKSSGINPELDGWDAPELAHQCSTSALCGVRIQKLRDGAVTLLCCR